MKIISFLLIIGLPAILRAHEKLSDSIGLPIKPERVITFTTDEASFLDVDVSPDGKTLIFGILGDFFTIPVGGGVARQITNGLAYNRCPVWSPDGKLIAYVSDRSGSSHLAIMSLSGKVHKTLGERLEEIKFDYDEQGPLWTPNGKLIANRKYLLNLDGDTIAYPPGVRNVFGISSDGILFYCREFNAIQKQCELFSYNPITGVRKSIMPPAKENDQSRGQTLLLRPRISPDGHWLTYINRSDSGCKMILHDLFSGMEKVLIPSINPTEIQVISKRYCFSPDSKSLFIGYGGKIHCINVVTGVNKVIPFTANVKVTCGSLNYNKFPVSLDSLEVKYVRSANANHRGNRLVFSALNKIFVMDMPNGIPRPLVDQSMGQFQPIFSPDGNWIAYVTWSDTSGGHLWRVPSIGGMPEQLTHIAGEYEHPAWSPDGNMIAVLKRRSKPISLSELQLIPLDTDTKKPQIVTDSVPSIEKQHLSFSSDGKRIMYMLELPYNSKITLPKLVSRQLDGKNLKVIAVSGGVPGMWDISHMSMSPDGRYIVYMLREDLYLLPIGNQEEPVLVYDFSKKIQCIRFAQGGIDPHWEQAGKILSWSYANQYYQIDPDKILRNTSSSEKTLTVINTVDQPTLNFTAPDRVVSVNIHAPRDFAGGTVAIQNARIITMKGDKIIERGTIIIRNGRIQAVDDDRKLTTPPGAKVINLDGKTIIPGFIDLHAHFEPAHAYEIFPQQSWYHFANLAYGVTTSRDPATTYESFGFAELIETGQMIGPRLYPSGQAIRPEYDVNSLDEARGIVRKRAIMGGVFMKQYVLPTRKEREILLMASKEAGLNITNESTISPSKVISMIKDGSTGVEHNPEWGEIFKDVTSLCSKSGTYFTPTLQVSVTLKEDGLPYFHQKYAQYFDWRLRQFTPASRINSMQHVPLPKDSVHPQFLDYGKLNATVRDLGGNVTLGSHGNDQGIGAHFELWALQMSGLSNLQALQSATILGAKGLGMQEDIGSIEQGKIADLIILNSNPLEDIHNSIDIQYIMKAGVLYDGKTLNTLWPAIKDMPKWKLNPTYERAYLGVQ